MSNETTQPASYFIARDQVQAALKRLEELLNQLVSLRGATEAVGLSGISAKLLWAIDMIRQIQGLLRQ